MALKIRRLFEGGIYCKPCNNDCELIVSFKRPTDIELSRLLNNFLRANTENNLFAKVTGKRKREIGLVVPARFSAVTTELHIAEVLERELQYCAKVMQTSFAEIRNSSWLFDEKISNFRWKRNFNEKSR